MMEDEMVFELLANADSFGYSVRMGLRNGNRMDVAQPIVFKKHIRHERAPYVAEFRSDQLQVICDSLYQAGFTPSDLSKDVKRLAEKVDLLSVEVQRRIEKADVVNRLSADIGNLQSDVAKIKTLKTD